MQLNSERPRLMPVSLMTLAALLSVGLITVSATGVQAAEPAGTLELQLRTRQPVSAESNRYHTVHRHETWQPHSTAVIVCDMWDLHHCLNATRRGAELAPRMNRLLKDLRNRGVTVIHAPSNCMAAYEDHPARSNALQVPRSKKLPQDIGKWCYQIPAEEKGTYPIDQTDGGEDDDPEEHREWAEKLAAMGRNPKAPWKSQTDLLDIDRRDFISDSGEEIWSILEQRDIDNVLLVGVHTNMCVLGRPFGLRQMAKNGKNVVLVRDMTDTMYNPARSPYVSHFTGTDLIVEHIEKFVCPTVTSDQLAGGEPFRFRNDKRPHVVIVMAEKEYDTDRTLPKFAVSQLGRSFRVSQVFADEKDRNNVPGLEVLDTADVLLLSMRRRVLPKDQLARFRKYEAAGKPIVAIRTSSHAFSLRNQKPPEDHFDWPEFDQDVLGGNYHNHHPVGPKVSLQIAPGAADHAILQGVDFSDFQSSGSLYKVLPLKKTASPLLIGSIPDQPSEPVAWTNKRKSGGRTFYTSLGHPKDFENAQFNRFLRNAVYWAADVPVPAETSPTQ